MMIVFTLTRRDVSRNVSLTKIPVLFWRCSMERLYGKIRYNY